MEKLRGVIGFIGAILGSTTAYANSAEGFFYKSGRFYVVVAILAIIMLILFVYLIRMDMRVRKMEKKNEE